MNNITGPEYIFLSYASVESDFALQLAVDLKNAGVNLWMDRMDIELGADWPQALQDGLHNSMAVITVLSKGFVQSRHCLRELARADRLKLPLVPILLAPLTNAEWPIEIERNQYIDFTQWKTELLYHQQLARLVNHLRDQFSTQIDRPLDPEAQYRTRLIATLKARNSLLLAADVEERPEPFGTFEWNLETGKQAKRRTATQFQLDAIQERRISLTNQLLLKLGEQSRLALLGEPGTGKSSLLDFVCLKLVYARQMNPEDNPLPVLVRLAEWPDALDFDEFLRAAVSFDLDQTDALLLLDGADELGPDSGEKLDQVRACLDNTAQHVIVSCRSQSFSRLFKGIKNLPTVTLYDLNLPQVKMFLQSAFSEQRANQLLEQYPGKYLQTLLCNPRMLSLLAGINYRLPLENMGATLRSLAEALVNQEQQKGLEDMLSYLALEYALARLAFEGDESVDYERALELTGAQAVLTSGARASFLHVTAKTVRFAYPVWRSYFAAVWMQQHGLDWQVVQDHADFDVILLCLAGLLPTPDDLITSLHEVHPELAMYCLITGASAQTVSAVLSRWFQCSLSPDPGALMQVPNVAEALLLILQSETWSIRQAAFELVQILPITTQHGVIDLLNIRNEDREHAALALKKIGQRAILSLLQYVNHANADLRHNAVWALDELTDFACAPGLVQALADSDPAIVQHAIQALGYLRDPATFGAIINTLGHSEFDVQQTALDTLQWLHEYVLDDLVQALEHPQSAVRQHVLNLLAHNLDDRVTDMLIEATFDVSLDVRRSAIIALADRESPVIIERLAECLEEEQLRAAAIDVLKRFRSAAAQAVLASAESSDQPGKKGSAADAKKRLKQAMAANKRDDDLPAKPEVKAPPEPPADPPDPPPDAINYDDILDRLLDRIHHGDWGDREEAAKALRDFAKTLQGEEVPDVVARLTPLLKADDWVLRWAAVEPLAWIGHVNIISDLLTLLDDENWMVRIAAIRGLQEMRHPDTVDALAACLSDSNNLVREAALEALSMTGDPAVIPLIADSLSLADEMLRLAAVQALADLNHPGVVPSLLKMLHDPDKHVRWAAVDGLRTLADGSHVFNLIQLLADTEKPSWEDERICDIAATILEEIGTDHAKVAVATWRKEQASANS